MSARFGRVGFCTWSSIGENVAYNMEDGEDAVYKAIEQWAQSVSGHRENMLNDGWTWAAVAAAENGNSVYFTAKFMSCW